MLEYAKYPDFLTLSFANSIYSISSFKGFPCVSGSKLSTPIESKDKIANKIFGFIFFLSNRPKIIGLNEDANVPNAEAIPEPIALDLAGYN